MAVEIKVTNQLKVRLSVSLTNHKSFSSNEFFPPSCRSIQGKGDHSEERWRWGEVVPRDKDLVVASRRVVPSQSQQESKGAYPTTSSQTDANDLKEHGSRSFSPSDITAS